MAISEPRVLDQVEFRVEAGKIREFVRATFAEDPVHTSAEVAHGAGYPAELATATHVVVAGHYRDQQAMIAALGLSLERVVVGSVSWQYLRPVVSGDRLRGTRRVVSDEQREGKRGGSMRMVTLETEYLDDGDEPVVRVREVLIERGTSS
jgi:acyl dehydratase